MIGKVCVDSNVLIYILDPRKSDKSTRCEVWLNYLILNNQIAFSPQAITETISVLSRKQVKADEIRQLIDPFEVYVSHPIDQAVIHRALHVFESYKTSWWDALMIGWAAQAGCSTLLSEDRQSAPEIEGVAIVSPFAIEPSETFGKHEHIAR